MTSACSSRSPDVGHKPERSDLRLCGVLRPIQVPKLRPVACINYYPFFDRRPGLPSWERPTLFLSDSPTAVALNILHYCVHLWKYGVLAPSWVVSVPFLLTPTPVYISRSRHYSHHSPSSSPHIKDVSTDSLYGPPTVAIELFCVITSQNTPSTNYERALRPFQLPIDIAVGSLASR